jgi:hypothetical protein
MQTVPQLGQHCGHHESASIVRYFCRENACLAPNHPLLHSNLKTLRATDSRNLEDRLATIRCVFRRHVIRSSRATCVCDLDPWRLSAESSYGVTYTSVRSRLSR